MSASPARRKSEVSQDSMFDFLEPEYRDLMASDPLCEFLFLIFREGVLAKAKFYALAFESRPHTPACVALSQFGFGNQVVVFGRQ